MGGFTGTFATILVVGAILDVLGDGGHYTLSDYRWALAVQIPLMIVGLVGVVVSRR